MRGSRCRSNRLPPTPVNRNTFLLNNTAANGSDRRKAEFAGRREKEKEKENIQKNTKRSRECNAAGIVANGMEMTRITDAEELGCVGGQDDGYGPQKAQESSIFFSQYFFFCVRLSNHVRPESNQSIKHFGHSISVHELDTQT